MWISYLKVHEDIINGRQVVAVQAGLEHQHPIEHEPNGPPNSWEDQRNRNPKQQLGNIVFGTFVASRVGFKAEAAVDCVMAFVGRLTDVIQESCVRSHFDFPVWNCLSEISSDWVWLKNEKMTIVKYNDSV